MVARTGQGTRAAILDAAYRCLVRYGYGGVSMRQIAREAGVALSQLHYHFLSKEHLLMEVMRRTTEKHVQEMATWLGQLTPERRLHGLLCMVRDRLREDPGWFRLLFDCITLALRDQDARRQLRGVFQEVSDEAARRISELWQLPPAPSSPPAAADRPWYARLSPQALGRVLIAALYGVALQLLVESDEASGGEPAWFEEILLAVSLP